MIIYDFNPNNLPDEHLRAIGLVIACASQTEEIMRNFIGVLLGVDNIETIALGTHMSLPMKDDIIRAVVELNAPSASAVDEVDDILDEIREAMQLRNAVAHNEFAIHPENGEIYSLREKARGSLQAELKPIKANDLLEAADRVFRAGMALQSYMMKTGLVPRTREKPLREPLNRKKSARAQRRAEHGDQY
ncbi:MAG: hypothetical protein ACKOPG_07255 [Novosphingobium sp.]